MRKIESRTRSLDEKSFIVRSIVRAINSAFHLHRLSALLAFVVCAFPFAWLRGISAGSRSRYRRFRFRFFSSRKRDVADPAARRSRVLLLEEIYRW